MTFDGLRRAGLAAALLFFTLCTWAQVPVPALTAPVTDLSGTLSAEQRKSLEERLAAFEAKHGSQIAVLLVPTTAPEAIEQFGIRVAEKWKVGRKGVDDGAILIVAMKDRAVRIEVGYGLEGGLPDATVKRIIEEYVIPRFKQGDFHGGIDAAVSRMMSVIEGEQLPPPLERGRSDSIGDNVEGLLGIGFILVFVVGGMIRAALGRFAGSGVIGAIGGIAAWLLVGSLVGAIVVGIIAAVLSLMGGMSGLGSSRRGGGWSSGGGWGGGSGGGSWGGGGGGFGGGGASGRW